MTANPTLRMSPLLPSILHFGEQTHTDSKGRSGFLITTGLQIISINQTNSVVLFPINSRGQVSDSCRLAVHRDAIDELIAALKDAKERR